MQYRIPKPAEEHIATICIKVLCWWLLFPWKALNWIKRFRRKWRRQTARDYWEAKGPRKRINFDDIVAAINEIEARR